jgi:hypothetical protein
MTIVPEPWKRILKKVELACEEAKTHVASQIGENMAL